MSNLAAFTMAWAAVQAVVGVHNLVIHLRRPTDLEYLAYSALSFGFAIYTFAAALLVDATSVADGLVAARIAYVGAPIAAGAFVVFAALLYEMVSSRVVVVAVAWAVLGLFLNLAGLFFDADVGAPSSPYHEPEQTLLAAVWSFGAGALIAWTLVAVLRSARVDRDMRILGAGAALLVVAVVHDQGVHFGGIGGTYWIEHAALGVTVLFSYMMLRRFGETESELERRTIEVRDSYLDLRRAQAVLIQREQLAAVGELSAVIAHEIRNPLAILRNATSGLGRARLSSDDRATLLSILAEEAERLGRLANDLSEYAQPLAPAVERLSVSDLLESEGRRAMAGAPEGLVVRVSSRDDVDLIDVDPALLGRALRSVVDNAMQAMPNGGELVLRVDRAELRGEAAVAVMVTDEGEGMNSMVRDKAINPFFTTRASGTGLGLAIVDRIVRAHHGVLSIETSYGKGTTVRLTLPLAPS